MTDYHIHIGQFFDRYYDAMEVFEAIENASALAHITQVYYSSTSTCRDDVELNKIEEEIEYAQALSSSNLTIKPYLWYIPKYAEHGISVKSAVSSFDYVGIKLHPGGHYWDLNNSIHDKALHSIFEWASKYNKIVLIHTGISPENRPSYFEKYFKLYPKANVILAHAYPLDETIDMLNTYPNVKCDISLRSQYEVEFLKLHCPTKILFGTDFPITHYHSQLMLGENVSLSEQYRRDCEVINFFHI